MKRKIMRQKLVLSRETLGRLSKSDLLAVAGGSNTPGCVNSVRICGTTGSGTVGSEAGCGTSAICYSTACNTNTCGGCTPNEN